MDKNEREDLKRAVYEIVKLIPKSRATSYAAIARAIGCPNMSRLVGRIMSEASTDSVDIPAHRVVNSQGVLSGKRTFGFSGEMQKLLELEGLVIVNDRIQNWRKIFWNPSEEIHL